MDILSLIERFCKAIILIVIVIVLVSLPGSLSLPAWQFYAFSGGTFHRLASTSAKVSFAEKPELRFGQLAIPSAWQVTASDLADVNGDGKLEWVLLVWRPWRDWPIQRWNSDPSPIVNFQDAAGDSCHLILLDPADGHELWAGSALPAPLLALAIGDVDGDGLNEVVTLEGEYATGRAGPASYVDVWGWNGFGFTLQWRSPPGSFRQLGLTDVNDDSILDITVQ